MAKNEIVVVLGASNKKERYSYRALKLLEQMGHHPLPVHPTLSDIDGHRCYHSLSDIKKDHPHIDTVTIYVNPEISATLEEALLSLAPKRVIFNPGSENGLLAQKLRLFKIEVEEACTLVLLNTGSY